MSLFRVPYRILAVTSFICLVAASAPAQITNVTNDQATPIPGVGHDYIRMLSETVNPANGSVSVRIQVPVPPGRRLTLPFAFTYDSSGVHHLISSSPGFVSWTSNASFLSQGGWGYSMPLVSETPASTSWKDPTTGISYSCTWYTDYIFQDASGNRHALGLAVVQNPTSQGCQMANPAPYSVLQSGDDFLRATVSANLMPVTVADADGTVYHFANPLAHSVSPSPFRSGLPDFIEDRNGNTISVTDSGNGAFTVSDTLSRSALVSSGFGTSGNTLTVSGLSTSYIVYWGTTHHLNFGVGSTTPSDTNCPSVIPNDVETQPVVTAVKLPNLHQYTFSYDSTYGLLQQITYPTGGYVKYTWNLNPQSEFGAFTDKNGLQEGCTYTYGMPAVQSRIVSFDGVNNALEQDFSYAPVNWVNGQWTTKQTTVTTHDYVRGTSFTTVYNYSPVSLPLPPNDYSHFASQVPVEQSVVYNDVGGATIRTVTKRWVDQYEMQGQQISDNGIVTSDQFFVFGSGAQITDKYECGSGQSCYNATQTSPPTAYARHTKTQYASFPATPIYPSGPSIFDRPSSVVIYDGTGTRVAETDDAYDQTAVGPATSTSHDDTNYGTSDNNRGNVNTVTEQCFPSCTNAVKTYTYDQTGQVLSMTDPCGNSSCSDVSGSNHNTTYSYADNYAGGTGTPPGQTNAYLTQITYPNTGVVHTESFSWGYNDGQLRSSTDQNNQTTTYTYNTPPSGCFPDGFDRLSSITYPDTGKTTYCYNDAPYNSSTPSPSVTTTKAINSSANLTTLTAFDGLGHTVRGVLTSDPDCSSGDRTDRTYDGLARVYQASNPYCSTGDSTYGLTTDVYDALGRPTQFTEPDGSVATSSYSGNCVTVSDEAGKTRQSCSDGLGRLTQVTEDPGTSPHLNYVANYSYDALGNLLTVNQKGGTTDSTQWRPRAFVYDSLSRLTSATNPESGTVKYVYDANGNLTSKTSPAPNQDGFPGRGSAGVTGNEQSIAGGPATAGTGSVTFSGTLQSKQVQTQAAAPGSGSVTINGTLQSQQTAAKAGTGSVAFSAPGSIQTYTFDPCAGTGHSCPQTVSNTGSITFTVAGQQFTINYTGNASQDATAMQTAINQGSSYVTAPSVSGSTTNSTMNLTAKTTGTGSNYAMSCCTYTWNTGSFNGTPFFSGPNDTASSGSSLTGGTDASTVYDSGSCTIVVNSGRGDSATWNGSGTTSSSIASTLASNINSDKVAPVTAYVPSGTCAPAQCTVNLTAKAAGASTNYSLSSSWTYDSSDFSSSSFTTSNSGSTLTGGRDASYTTVYDSGTSTITVKGHPDSFSWSGSATTTFSIASALISKINADSAAFVTAGSTPVCSGNACTINLTATTTGASTNYTLSSSSTYDSSNFSSASFSSNSGTALTGGNDAGATTYDTGTVWVTINTTQYPVGYDQNSSSPSLASALASTISAGSLANASASGSSISITAKNNGSATNYSLSSGSSTSQSGSFSSPSFSVSVSGPSLTGGTDPGGTTVTANFLYDALNRLIQKSFSDGATPTVKDGYDAVALSGCTVAPPALTDAYPVGRRTAMCDGAGAESWNHDTMGRVLHDSRTTNGVTMTYAYTPYLDGSINTITYPSGRVITYTLKSSGANTASRLLSAVDTANSINYATAASYTPAGGLSSFTNGASLISTHYYSSRLQPCRISVTTSGTPPANCTDLNNKGNVLDLTFGFSLGSADNGNVAYINNNKDNTRSQNFTYDSLNRLTTAQTQTSGVTIPNSNCWGLTFGYDPWGNLLSSSTTGPAGCGEPLPLNVSATTSNQITGYCYDAAGNLALNSTCPVGSFTPTYSYNAENQLTSTAGVNYIYDGDGRRVMKSSGALYWYGMSSDPLDETDLAGNTNDSSFFEYVFFNGRRIARRDYQNNVNYYFSDHLGTSRVVTNSSGSILDDSDFYPFGGERPVTSSSGNHYKFTGKERDPESGLDNFGARYNSSSMGRFMTPDWSSTPAAVPFADPANPQSLNLYTYVTNNPLNRTDPLGHDWFYVDKKWQWQKGHTFHDQNGNATKDKGYAGLLVAQATGTDKKTGATTYSLTLYDQDKKVFQGNAFSGGNGNPAIRDGNYTIRLDRHDPNPTTLNPNSPLHNPPPVYGIQKMENFYFNLPDGRLAYADVTGAYGHMRAHLNPWHGTDEGDFLHEQYNGFGYTHGCLCYGTQTQLSDILWKMPPQRLPAAVDVPVTQP